MAYPASSSKNVFIRENSPGVFGAALAGQKDTIAQKVSAVDHAVGQVETMNALIHTLPQRLRSVLGPYLRSIRPIHDKFCNASNALQTLEENLAKGTWPKFIANLQNPFASVQISSEAGNALSPLLSEDNTWFKLQKEAALERIIALKRAEVTELEKLCSLSVVEETLKTKLEKNWEILSASCGKHTPEGQGISVPKIFKEEHDMALLLAPSWAARTWAFTVIKAQHLESNLEKKRKLAADATTAMDVDKVAPALQKTIDDAVAAALKQGNKPANSKRGQAKGKGKPGNKKNGPRPSGPKQKPKGLKASAPKGVTKPKRKRIVSGAGSGPKPKKR